jgi:phosphotransferase system enzyme I (PtsI)
MRVTLADIPRNSIVFAQELAPTDTAEAKSGCVSAFVTEVGGETSHAAIMAKAKGIPYVASVDFQAFDAHKSRSVIVDGRTGDIILSPSSETLSKYRELKKQLNFHIKGLEKESGLQAETIDGYKVRLSANVEMLNDLECLKDFGSEGVGLFRSEYIFLTCNDFPSEEEQFIAYRSIVESIKGFSVVIRTFDIGGDKFRDFEELRNEVNPFLGCRAIRFMLKEPEVFKCQLRAILRASAFGDVKILFPMISGLPELLEAKGLIEESKSELRSKGIPFSESVEIGCMIEIPSAAITCDLLAHECDFLSIGTNDLVQYSLAVDRGNQLMSYLYTPMHPCVIRLIKMVVSEGCRNGIPVSVCGEIAADPRFTSLLLGLGVRELSVAARFIPIVKNAIRNSSIVDSSHLAERVMTLPTDKEIQDLLTMEYQQSFPDDFLYNNL